MNYQFEWMTYDNHGKCDGVYNQSIWGHSLADALDYFEGFHGKVETYPNGTGLEITKIKTL